MSERPKNDYKEKIYKAAQKLFYEKGYTSTSVAEIIELSGTNRVLFTIITAAKKIWPRRFC